jgi:hypothetical protein
MVIMEIWLPDAVSPTRRMLTGTIAFSGSGGGCSPSRWRSARTAPATAARPTSLSVPPARRAARSSSRPAW